MQDSLNATTILFLIFCFVLVVLLSVVFTSIKDASLLYVGDCVDIVADREGAQGLTPKEKWDTFAEYCTDRYQNR